jgi:hypothetical protein
MLGKCVARKTKSILTISLFATVTCVFGQTLTNFKYSNCLKECVNDSSRINEIKTSERITTISLKTYAPCNGNLDGAIEINGSILNLKFWTRPTIVKGKTGKDTKLIEVSDCNCMFNFTYQISGLATVEQSRIKVNGLSLRAIDARNKGEEISIELDSLK